MEISAAFLLGLVGSLHCAGMCGPLALALPSTGAGLLANLPGRLAYNLGRLVTYGLLGLCFGLLGKTLFLAGFQRWISIGVGAALLAGLFLSDKLRLAAPVIRLVARLKGAMGSLLKKRSTLALGLLGLLNGLLPCGLVYVACAGATATGGLGTGVEYMAAFGLGTVPMMLGLSLSGRLLPAAVRARLSAAVPAAVFLLAVLLILRGLSLGIPYLSPDLSVPGAKSCCHH